LSWEREREHLLELYARLTTASARAGKHEPVGAQQRHAREGAIETPGTPGQRGSQGDGAHHQFLAKRAAQLAQTDQARMAVDGRYTWLPDRDRPAAGEHTPGLIKRRPDVA
jgi:hypothetical protein